MCFTWKYNVGKTHTKLHLGHEWHIFHYLCLCTHFFLMALVLATPFISLFSLVDTSQEDWVMVHMPTTIYCTDHIPTTYWQNKLVHYYDPSWWHLLNFEPLISRQLQQAGTDHWFVRSIVTLLVPIYTYSSVGRRHVHLVIEMYRQ